VLFLARYKLYEMVLLLHRCELDAAQTSTYTRDSSELNSRATVWTTSPARTACLPLRASRSQTHAYSVCDELNSSGASTSDRRQARDINRVSCRYESFGAALRWSDPQMIDCSRGEDTCKASHPYEYERGESVCCAQQIELRTSGRDK